MFVLLVGLVFSGYKIVNYFYTSYDEKQNFNNVEKLVESEYEDEKIQYNDFEILKKYKKVYEKNNDLVGWIKIKNTNIDYPVMQTKDDYSYYLKRNFNKKSSIYGTPFVGEGCGINPNSDNVIIYGHNMKNGTMFADLNKYKDKEFYESHKEVQWWKEFFSVCHMMGYDGDVSLEMEDLTMTVDAGVNTSIDALRQTISQ